MAADGPVRSKATPNHTTRACFASHDRLEEGVTGPSPIRPMSCAAAAVRISASETLVD